VRKLVSSAVLLAAASCIFALAGGAAATTPQGVPDRTPRMGGGDVMGMQHGVPEGHLPGSSANVELIGELEPTDQFGPIVEGQIADLAVFKNFAYLNSPSSPRWRADITARALTSSA
jgi:hypothetical protein